MKPSLPLVSIIIPTYNQEKYLSQAMESALVQDYQNIEIIIADDNSTDLTSLVVRKYTDTRIHYFKNIENIGRVRNYRKALYEYAHGDWVLNLDGDDTLLDKTYISAAVHAIKTKPETVFVFADRYELNNEFEMLPYTDKASKSKAQYLDGTSYVLSLPKPNHRIHHLTVLYNRKAAMAINFYSCDIISSDYESLWRLAIGNTIAHIPEPVAIWRRHDNNASRTGKIDNTLKNYQLFVNVHDYAIQKLDINYNKIFELWLIRNVAKRYYTSLISLLKSGDFENLSKLKYFVKNNFLYSYRKVALSPKTAIKSFIAIVYLTVNKLLRIHK